MAMINCKECGNQVSDAALACPKCGAKISNGNTSSKSKTVALLLAILIGTWGVHNFYVGKTGKGVFQLLTFGGLGIWTLIDIIKIATGNYVDAEGKKLV